MGDPADADLEGMDQNALAAALEIRIREAIESWRGDRAPERLQLWREAFPKQAALEPALDLVRTAERHELSGGTIVNVARYAALRSLSRGDHLILSQDVEDGIRRELLKEGRAF